MRSYWVVTNNPTVPESRTWKTDDAIDMVLGNYDKEAPRWSFNPSPWGKPPAGLDRVRDGDELLLFNGSNARELPRRFVAYARVIGSSKVKDEFRVNLSEPLGKLEPVHIVDLQISKVSRVVSAEFHSLFRGYHHGPLDNLAAHPGPSSKSPQRGLARWRIIMEAGTGQLTL